MVLVEEGCESIQVSAPAGQTERCGSIQVNAPAGQTERCGSIQVNAPAVQTESCGSIQVNAPAGRTDCRPTQGREAKGTSTVVVRLHSPLTRYVGKSAIPFSCARALAGEEFPTPRGTAPPGGPGLGSLCSLGSRDEKNGSLSAWRRSTGEHNAPLHTCTPAVEEVEGGKAVGSWLERGCGWGAWEGTRVVVVVVVVEYLSIYTTEQTAQIFTARWRFL